MPSQNGDSKLRLRSHAITERRFKVTVVVTCSDTRIFVKNTISFRDSPNSAAIPSDATSREIRRLVSSSPPAPPNRRHWISPPPSPQLRLLARYADSYLSVRRRLRIDVTGYLRRHPLSCDFLRDTPTRILVSVGASESTSLDISAAIPSVATSCEIRRLVS